MKHRIFIATLLFLSFGLFSSGYCQTKSEEEVEEEVKEKIEKEFERFKVKTTIPEEIESAGFIGIYITSPQTGSGAKVDDIVTESPADKAGIKKGDIIVELNGKKVTDEEFLLNEVAKTKPWEKVNLKIRRKSKTIMISVQTTTRPKQSLEETSKDWISEIQRTFRGDRNYLGIKTCDIVSGLDEYFGVEDGVLIIETVAKGFAEKVGLKPGDVIVKIDDTDIPDSRTLRSIMRKKEPGATITIKLIRHKKTMTVKGFLENE